MTQEIVENTSTEALNPARERLNNLIGNIVSAIKIDTPPKPFVEHGLDSVVSKHSITEYQLRYLEVLRECAQAAFYLALTGKLEKSTNPEHPVIASIRELAEFLDVNPDELKGFIDPKSIAEHETNRRFALLQEAVQKAVLEAVANTPEYLAVKVMGYLLSSDPYNPESSTPTSKWFDQFLNQHPELEDLDPLYYAAILVNASRYQEAINCIKSSPLTEYQKQIIVREILGIQLSDPNIHIPIEDVPRRISELEHLTPKSRDWHIAEILVNRASNNPRITIKDVSDQIRGLGGLDIEDRDRHIAEILVNRASNDPSIPIETVSDQIRGLGGLDLEERDWHIADILVNRASNNPRITIEEVSKRIRELKDLGSRGRDWQIANILVNRASNDPSIPIEYVSDQIRGLKDLFPNDQDRQIAEILVNRASNDPSITIEDVSDQMRGLGRLDPKDRDRQIAKFLVNRASRDINTKIKPNTEELFIDKVIELYSDPTTLQRLLLEYIDSSEGSVSQ